MHKLAIRRSGAGQTTRGSHEVEVLVGELAAVESRARLLGLSEVAHFAAVAAAAANDAFKSRQAAIARHAARHAIPTLRRGNAAGRRRQRLH